MFKNRNEEHEKLMKYVNKIANRCCSEDNEERQVIGTLLHCLTYKLKCKGMLIKKGWLERISIKYQKNYAQPILNRKNSGILLQNVYEDIKAAILNDKQTTMNAI